MICVCNGCHAEAWGADVARDRKCRNRLTMSAFAIDPRVPPAETLSHSPLRHPRNPPCG